MLTTPIMPPYIRPAHHETSPVHHELLLNMT
jgi:hypothetical protein